MTCEFTCQDGWLVASGVTDSIVLEDNGTEYEYVRLLVPQSDADYVTCPCNPVTAFNPDLAVDPLDIWRITPDGGKRLPLTTNDSHFYQF